MRELSKLVLPLIMATPAPVLARTASPFLQTGIEQDAPDGYTAMCAADGALCRRFRPALSAPRIEAPAPEVALPSLALPSLARFATPAPAPSYRLTLPSLAPPAPDPANWAPPAITAALVAPAPPSLDLPSRLGRLPAAPPPQDTPRLALLRQPTAAILPLPETAADPAAPSGTPDEQALLARLRKINAHVNHRVFQQTDMVLFGRPEVWRPSGDDHHASGDCEDLALEKRVQLIAADFPRERLFMAVVYSRMAGLHAVLVARMAQGDLVLDSRTGAIRRWADTGYEWLSIQSPDDPDRWFAPTDTGS